MRRLSKKGTVGLLEVVESQECGCGTGIVTDQPEDETDCGHETGEWEWGFGRL
jgi:hypothetical protein